MCDIYAVTNQSAALAHRVVILSLLYNTIPFLILHSIFLLLIASRRGRGWERRREREREREGEKGGRREGGEEKSTKSGFMIYCLLKQHRS